MGNKKYQVQIELEIKAITCPGVWLCPSGGVELSIKTLGYTFSTTSIAPYFPIIYHETFTMNGFFKCVECLIDLEKALRAENLEIAMWQNGKRLAHYSGKLGPVLVHGQLLRSGIDNEIESSILMSPSKCFPGVIGPKIEYISKIKISDHLHHNHHHHEDSHNHHELTRSTSLPICTQFVHQQHSHSNSPVFKRQKPVCHYSELKDTEKSSCLQYHQHRHSRYECNKHDCENCTETNHSTSNFCDDIIPVHGSHYEVCDISDENPNPHPHSHRHRHKDKCNHHHHKYFDCLNEISSAQTPWTYSCQRSQPSRLSNSRIQNTHVSISPNVTVTPASTTVGTPLPSICQLFDQNNNKNYDTPSKFNQLSSFYARNKYQADTYFIHSKNCEICLSYRKHFNII